MATKNGGVLASLARTVGTAAGVVVVKTTQLKDEVVRMGSAATSPTPAASPVKPPAKEKAAKKAAKKPVVKAISSKKPVSRAPGKKKKAAAVKKKVTKRKSV